MKTLLLTVFILGLFYIIAPGAKSVMDLPPLPDSLKSTEPGDTNQVANIAAYFSNSDRAQITKYYYDFYRRSFILGWLIPPIKLNHPPEYARQVVRNEIYLTFLEEYTYPLRDSILIAGYEPYIDNNLLKRPHNFLADHIYLSFIDTFFVSKTTLKYIGSNIFYRILVYLGIWLVSYFIYKLFSKLKEG